MNVVRCGKCQLVLDERSDIPPEERKPCPNCGSTSRAHAAELVVSIENHISLGFKAKHGGKGKPFVEGISGDSLSTKQQKWMRLERVIDRENDSYKEVVTDPETGQEVHRSEEPLSQHRGHGSDKKRSS